MTVRVEGVLRILEEPSEEVSEEPDVEEAHSSSSSLVIRLCKSSDKVSMEISKRLELSSREFMLQSASKDLLEEEQVPLADDDVEAAYACSTSSKALRIWRRLA